MKKEIIYNKSFILDEKIEIDKIDDSYILSSKVKSEISIELKNISEIFWPNREGELIKVDNIISVLESNKLNKASICYPATASMKLFILFDNKKKEAVILYSQADKDGKISIFSLMNNTSMPILKIEASNFEFKVIKYKGENIDKIFDLFKKDNLYKTILPQRYNLSKYQVQVGLFSPYNETNVSKDKGYDVLIEISNYMKKYIKDNNILHIFSYHGAHDSIYPEYFASPFLGGYKRFKNAIDKIHENNQRCSLYMNARLFDATLLKDYPFLEDSIIRDSKKNFIIESYYNRDFFVMDPQSKRWRNLLCQRAKYLKKLGCDIIQLDQVAGRAAIGEVGTKWGSGYRELIKAIQELGVEVWIQGINEIYSANRFELCYRFANILEDGTIRGGHPFGKSYPLVPKILKSQNYIIPLASCSLINNIDRDLISVDLENKAGELSLYSSTYIDNLITNLRKYYINDKI